MHLEELEDPQKFAEEGVRMITQKEYVSRLHELKAEIAHSWQNDDRVTSLKLTIKASPIQLNLMPASKSFLPFLVPFEQLLRLIYFPLLLINRNSIFWQLSN